MSNNVYFCILYKGERCVTPNNYYGICVLLPQCPAIVNYYGQNPNHPTVINFLFTAQRNCGTRSIQQNPLVCCLDSGYYNRPQPKPQPQTQFQPQPQPVYRPQPTAQPIYRPLPQPTSQPVYRPSPQATAQPIYQPVPQTTTTPPIYRPEPQPTNAPFQTTAQPAFRPEPQPQTVPQTTQPIQPRPETPPNPTLNEKSCKDPNGVDGKCDLFCFGSSLLIFKEKFQNSSTMFFSFLFLLFFMRKVCVKA